MVIRVFRNDLTTGARIKAAAGEAHGGRGSQNDYHLLRPGAISLAAGNSWDTLRRIQRRTPRYALCRHVPMCHHFVDDLAQLLLVTR